jgi:hypothetical protein
MALPGLWHCHPAALRAHCQGLLLPCLARYLEAQVKRPHDVGGVCCGTSSLQTQQLEPLFMPFSCTRQLLQLPVSQREGSKLRCSQLIRRPVHTARRAYLGRLSCRGAASPKAYAVLMCEEAVRRPAEHSPRYLFGTAGHLARQGCRHKAGPIHPQRIK